MFTLDVFLFAVELERILLHIHSKSFISLNITVYIQEADFAHVAVSAQINHRKHFYWVFFFFLFVSTSSGASLIDASDELHSFDGFTHKLCHNNVK